MKRAGTVGELGMPAALHGPGRVVSVPEVRPSSDLHSPGRGLTDFASSAGFRGRPREVRFTWPVGIAVLRTPYH